ncbi:MAG: beta-lactamase [Geminicoccaceae bacterium]|jgi:CubicO group peptidase (beta-lactamase class C family)|nr:beta-lactamase [Geminicoccaceae bacterium]
MTLFKRFPIVSALTLLAGAACGTPQGDITTPEVVNAAAADSAFVAALRAKLTTDVAAGTFSGAVLVTRDGKTLFEGAYGLADREKNIPNTLETKFRAASMYKMMTATAVLQLVQEGKLRLDETVGTYLPDYPNADVKSKVTLHHLLTHTGGTGDIFGPQFVANRLQLRNISDYVRLYGERGLQFTPGAQHAYSNYGFILLGAIIERVTGKSYDDHVGARVLAPAGMTSTGTAPEDSLVPGRAVGYMHQGSPIGPLVSNAPTLPYRGTSAGGGYSTVGDFARFAVAVRDQKLLDPTHTTLLYTGKVKVNLAGTIQYAYGFMDRIISGRRWVGHGGSDAGMNGELVFEPNGGYVVVVLTNFDPPSAGSMMNFIANNLPSSSEP